MDVSSESTKAKACGNCKKGKAKCYGVLSSDSRTGPRCERCTRLHKECIMPLPPKKKLPRQSRAAQISQLEQKVDDLVSILGVNKNLPISSESTATCTSSNGESFQQTADVAIRVPTPNSIPVQDLRSPNHEETVPMAERDPDFLLNKYQETLAVQFPFVTIPASMRASELRQIKPFLYKTIIMAASLEDIPHQVELSKDIMKHMTDSMFGEGERNLDLLQGLLVYSVWCQFNFMTSRGQMNMLLGIMSSLIIDLRLVGTKSWTRQDVFAEEIYHEVEGRPQRITTADEKKAVLGCFYVSSWVCASLTRLDPIRSTPFIRECCDELERDEEDKGHTNVVHLTKLQFIVEKICLLQGRGEARTQHALSAPIGISIKLYWEQLQSFKKTLPAELSENFMVTRNHTCAEILLLELGFEMAPTSSGLRAGGNLISQRIDILHACLTSIISFFTVFLAAPLSRVLSVSVINASHMVHSIAVLSKLSLFEAEDWDPKYVRATLDLNVILERLIERLRSTAVTYDQTDSHPGLKRGCRVLQTLKDWYNVKIASASAAAEFDASNGAGNFEIGADQYLSTDQFDLMDAEFWNGIPGSWVSFN